VSLVVELQRSARDETVRSERGQVRAWRRLGKEGAAVGAQAALILIQKRELRAIEKRRRCGETSRDERVRGANSEEGKRGIERGECTECRFESVRGTKSFEHPSEIDSRRRERHSREHVLCSAIVSSCPSSSLAETTSKKCPRSTFALTRFASLDARQAQRTAKSESHSSSSSVTMPIRADSLTAAP